ncbi:MAG TPA: valine--tRNA ligase [Caldisericia bacterium]|nr:valine--tRNA ligase [Caldisericia bacterium]HPF49781.1 valine--tRNA ligase [Caldisericia bacterium]HPI84342.1 valine--tRNA ligase [Caldisericia bacterium]HPQ93769.1 valine--tRNA ligase [Caldisericia bacterium]HRV74807.1 valine--tRNA ligase [Caldisericia bacterium]
MDASKMPAAYDPKNVEDRIYQFWLDGGWFHSEPDNREPFVVMMPLPNVTGILHTGHALNNGLQDLVVRFNRMRGKNAMWMPGVDHAGVATQIVVERDLYEREGKSRFDIGRDEFVKKVWNWKETHGNIITSQLKKLGISCDWDRFSFTMDEGYQKAVKEAFCHYYEKGYIYKGNKVINWCPNCQTAISDVEVEHEDVGGHLWHVRYPFEDNPSDGVVIATTRPETMLGDTAVAVNPGDERYKNLVGKKVVLPIVDKPIPIVADDYVDMEFGTGVVKITPAHDPNDFGVGQRHNLPMPVIMGPDGKLTAVPERYKGMTMLAARKKIVAELEEKGLLVKVEDHLHAVGHHDKCKTRVEPLLSNQWFMKMKELAAPAIKVVEDEKVKFIPARWTKVYYEWMNNIQDWCLSRQCWWGHRIPIFYCNDCNHIFADRGNPSECPKCGGSVRQDEDSLDTWFSSALWPFATLGWPEKTADLEYYHPGSVLITAHDIIFFWVARMIFSSLEFMGDIPFTHTYLTGLIRDEQGRKMSKSLKNAIDPLDVIEKYGTDALRFTLMFLSTAGGQDIKLGDSALTESRNFINKLWNASRFVIMNLDGFEPGEPEGLAFIDRWILSRLKETTTEVIDAFENYDIGRGVRAMNDFFWSDFCDWYVELTKQPIQEGGAEKLRTQRVLHKCLDAILKLLHPVIPFVTEEIWQSVPHDGQTIMIQDYPKPEDFAFDADSVADMNKLQEAIRSIRNLKALLRIHQGIVPCSYSAEGSSKELLEREKAQIIKLSRVEGFDYVSSKPEGTVAAVSGDMTFYLDVAGKIDIAEELKRIDDRQKKAQAELDKIVKLLSNEGFVAKAPPDVIEKNKAKQAELGAELEGLSLLAASLKD